MSKITIYDVAKAANCSAATVSLALNNSNRIRPETQEHVMKVVTQMGYTPSHIAQSLHSKSTNTLGLVVPNVENPLFSMMISGIEKCANAKGYSTILGIADSDDKKENFYLNMLQCERVDGLILFPSFLHTLSEKINRLNGSKIPIVLCGSSGNEIQNISYVKCDNRIGSYTAITHLIDIGCRRIGCIFPSVNSSQYESRMTGYQDALYYNGIPFRQELVKICSPDNASIVAATTELLEEQQPDGIFCLYDYAAISVIRAILRSGRRIPDDVALIGYDNIQISDFLPISLSSIDTRAQEVGQKATEILIQKIADANTPAQQIILKPDLVVRESTRHTEQ